MAGKSKIGVFFGINSLSIVETQKNKLLSFFDAPHSLFDDTQQPSAQNIPDEIKLNAIIQKSLRDKKIETSDVCLSLPTHEAILRSFFIPWMTSAEVKGVVDFEVRRYIPFKLEELVYGYHSITVTEKKNRRIRILFVAVRKESLEKYCSILEQAGLRITYAEPAPLSLIRILTSKKLIERKKKYAIVQLNKLDGTIMITDQSVPQFLRDFRFTPSAGDFGANPEILNARLVNEIRISLDYYRRQHSQAGVDQILFISDAETTDRLKTLEEDLGLSTKLLNARTILNTEEEVALGTLNALGVGMHDDVAFPVKIDLARTRDKPPELEKPLEKTPVNYVATIKLATVCTFVVILAFLLSSNRISRYQKRLANLTDKVGHHEAITVEDLEKKRKDELNKIDVYKSVRLKSNVSFFLSRVPDLLPDEAWLIQLTVTYSDIAQSGRTRRRRGDATATKLTTKVSISLAGYVYLPDTNQQIYLVNNFLNNLRNDEEFLKVFDNVVLNSAQKENLENYNVTRFQISCN